MTQPRPSVGAARPLGALAGVLSGLLGIGGGLVLGPALALRGTPLPRATGTALAVVLPVACVAVLTELWLEPRQLLVWLALALALGGQLGAPCGRAILARLPRGGLRAAFIALLVYAAARNLGWFGGLPAASEALVHGAVAENLVAVGLGVLAGVAAVLFGVGGGVVMVPGMVLLLGIDVRTAMATSLLAMIPTAAAGLRIAARDGRVEAAWARALAWPALVGAVVGVSLRNRALAPEWLAPLFGGFLLFVALRLATQREAR